MPRQLLCRTITVVPVIIVHGFVGQTQRGDARSESLTGVLHMPFRCVSPFLASTSWISTS